MNLALFYDTETTGLPLWSQPSEDPAQPHLVQLATCLVNLDTRKVLSTLDLIIRPNGWVIPEETVQVHGITQEHAMLLGVPEEVALDAFMSMWQNAPHRQTQHRVGHNESFDARIIRIALKRHTDALDPSLAIPPSDEWKEGTASCTQRLSTLICNLPPTEKMKSAKNFGPKTPNLGEAFEFFTGQPMQGAHNALNDVHACMAVYFGIQDHMAAAKAAA